VCAVEALSLWYLTAFAYSKALILASITLSKATLNLARAGIKPAYQLTVQSITCVPVYLQSRRRANTSYYTKNSCPYACTIQCDQANGIEKAVRMHNVVHFGTTNNILADSSEMPISLTL
jgi:hypothetical protein